VPKAFALGFFYVRVCGGLATRSVAVPGVRVAPRSAWWVAVDYSDSIVAGGLLEMSQTTRLTPGTSLLMRV